MSTLALTLLVIFIVATGMFYIAGDLYGHGTPWAQDVCSLSYELCDNPGWSVVATGVMALVYFGLRSAKM
jgi:hypothetical protein